MGTSTLSTARGWSSVRQIAWPTVQMFGSRLGAQAAGFAVTILVARALEPSGLGVYTFVITTALLLSELPGTGLDMSMVRLAAPAWSRDRREARSLVAFSALGKGAAGLIWIALGVPLARPIAAGLLGQPDLVGPIRLAAVAALALGMTELVLSALQAQERFGQLFLVNLAIAGLKLIPIVMLGAIAALTLTAGMSAFVLAAYAGLLISAWVAWRAWRGPTTLSRAALRRLIGFSRWVVLATLLGALTGRLDVLALTQLAGTQATGVYASGKALALPFSIAGSALGAVLLPKASRAAAEGHLASFLWRASLRIVLVTIAAAVAAVVLGPVILALVYSGQYAGAVPIYRVSVLTYAVQIVTWPFLVVVMVLDHPQVLAALSLFVLIAVVVGYAVAIPLMGALGAAWVYLGVCGLVLIPYVLIAQRLLQGREAAVRRTPEGSLDAAIPGNDAPSSIETI